jgi:signal transduction histidine kinase
MVLAPALLSLSVGIVALALWREAFDIVIGVLVLTFAGAALVGGAAAIVFVRRGARLAELQAEFVANVSHELRTPLAGIRLVAETLEAGRGDDPERLRALTEMLGEEVRRLEDLVERVLAWRRLKAGGLGRDEPELVAVEDLVAELVASARRLPEGQGVDIRMQAPHDLPRVLGDRWELRHALGNVIHNALKFGGRHGPVEVGVTAGEDQVRIDVRDRGPGIAPDEIEHVFERFYRGSRRSSTKRGTGLGLDIVKTVVEAHGGQVQIESPPNQGTVCTVRLPATSRTPSPATAVTTSDRESGVAERETEDTTRRGR